MSCPICGNTYKNHNSWVKCRRFGCFVCDFHCKVCKHFSGYETSFVKCFYPNFSAHGKNGNPPPGRKD